MDNLSDSRSDDNGFEKVDPYSADSSTCETTPQDDIVSSSSIGEEVLGLSRGIVNQPQQVDTSPAQGIGDAAFDGTSDEKARHDLQHFGSSQIPVTNVSSPGSASCGYAGSGCLKSIDPRVLELIYWRDIKKTGIVFGSMMVLLLSLAMFSVLSVVAYLSLAALSVTISFRLYKNILGAVQKSGEGHPFKQYLDADIKIPEEKVHQAADIMARHLTNTLKELRHLFFIEDLVDSLKFVLLLWVFTYIGAWFNGMTLILLGTVAIFSLPKVYETYKVQIDQFAGLAYTKVKAVFKQLQEKIPIPGKKKQQ